MSLSRQTTISRAIIDRRAPVDRRILDLGPGYPEIERREQLQDRRHGWEDRFAWERTSKWSSNPVYSEIW